METPTYSSVEIKPFPTTTTFLKVTTLAAAIIGMNPTVSHAKTASVWPLSGQIFPWELDTKARGLIIPLAMVPDEDDFSDLYIKPVAVRQYKVKARVRSKSKGTIH